MSRGLSLPFGQARAMPAALLCEKPLDGVAGTALNRPASLPIFALFEEGHRFAPASGDAPSLGIMPTITSEGRKFGFGLGIISQRPAIDGLTRLRRMRVDTPKDGNENNAYGSVSRGVAAGTRVSIAVSVGGFDGRVIPLGSRVRPDF